MPRVIPEVTIVDVSMQDILDLWIYKDADGNVIAEFEYRVREAGGQEHHTGHLRKTLGAQALQQLTSWVNAQVLPEINQQEGM